MAHVWRYGISQQLLTNSCKQYRSWAAPSWSIVNKFRYIRHSLGVHTIPRTDVSLTPLVATLSVALKHFCWWSKTSESKYGRGMLLDCGQRRLCTHHRLCHMYLMQTSQPTESTLSVFSMVQIWAYNNRKIVSSWSSWTPARSTIYYSYTQTAIATDRSTVQSISSRWKRYTAMFSVRSPV